MSFKMEPTPEIIALTEKCKENTGIAPELYTKYDVKKVFVM